MSDSDRYWRDLGIAILVSFIVGEGTAFITRNADGTLTAWGNIRIRRHPLGRLAWWAFMAWLAYHMDSGKLGIPWRWNVEEALDAA